MASNTLNKLRQAFSRMISLKAFDTSIDKLQVIDASPGSCTCQLKISEKHTNLNGDLHGGAIALLIDNVSTLALYSNENGVRGVSVNMHISYMRSAKTGDEIIIDSKIEKSGKKLAFLTAEIRHKNSNKIIATGTHTKFVGHH
ncbi:hypothetical protein LSH36_72g07046 [Paralvinella palmiformis]|uniref:Acyl-coenzyme A thioesterase 13 n=1 Tax=Paralvinella palmiformis TaxID=53620 RepID=A0AAD9NE71_9ANNE|nr:hypothetical protein LSH36_72g07046 [Paralvinella palmiformis]